MNGIFKLLATLGPVGYLPASGSAATALAVFFVWMLRDLPPHEYLVVSLFVLLVSWLFVGRALRGYDPRNHDPSEIVLDEVAGFMIIFNAVSIAPLTLAAAFFLFRFFDIVKPFGIRACENLVGAVGVMLDDLLAAFFSGALLFIAAALLDWV